MPPLQTCPSSAPPAMRQAVSGESPAVPRRKRRPRLQDAFLVAVVLSGLFSGPLAWGQQIPFLATNQAGAPVCLQCMGPWVRASDLVGIDAGARAQQFYTAEVTIFSPFGAWHCYFVPVDDIGTCDFSSPEVQVNFCLDSIPSPEVDLTITPGPGLTVNFGSTCESTAAAAFLGDTSGAGPAGTSHPDQDVFHLDAGTGEAITTRLEGHPAKGHRGTQAGLLLQDVNGTTLGSTSGAVPLTLEVTLPQAGTYTIAVVETPEAAEAFRGHYRLSVQAASKALLTLEPQRSVEP
ncbi:MAG: hypothetical protein M3361_19910 [Candidatus Tectomicrobia bacterium]|nr:hypothetical protein [Candidatus Tectomicrobia bacterium]